MRTRAEEAMRAQSRSRRGAWPSTKRSAAGLARANRCWPSVARWALAWAAGCENAMWLWRELCALGFTAGNVAQDALHVRLADERTDLGPRIHGIADDERGGARLQAFQEGALQAPLHKHARAIRAYLAR